jgi:hypothetical protein
MPAAMPQADSASAATATPIAGIDCVLMTVFLRFRRPPVGRAERAEPATVAVLLQSCCGLRQPGRHRATHRLRYSTPASTASGSSG